MPISYINANFPITADSATGYHNIASIIDTDTFTIVIDYIANTTISNTCRYSPSPATATTGAAAPASFTKP